MVASRTSFVWLLSSALMWIVLAGETVRGGTDGSKSASANSASELVDQALRADLEGDAETRAQQLAAAIAADPNCDLARWHSGQVRRDGKWVSLAEAEKEQGKDYRMAEYRRRRDAAEQEGVSAQVELAQWCGENKLADQEEFHWMQVMRHPQRTDRQEREAAKHLRLQRSGNQWLTSEEWTQRQEVDRDQQAARRKYTTLARRLRDAFHRNSVRAKLLASDQLEEVSDVGAIPVLESECSLVDSALSEELVTWLARLPEHQAAAGLVRQAVLSPFPRAAGEAAKALAKRELGQFVPILLEGLTAPIESTFQIATRPDGTVAHEHLLQRRGAEATLAWRQRYTAGTRASLARAANPNLTAMPGELNSNFWDRVTVNQVMELGVAADRAANIEADVAQFNASIAERNERVVGLLRQTTGQSISNNPTDWWEWWQNYNDMYYSEKPTLVAETNQTFQRSLLDEFSGPPVGPTAECFVRGTPVRTYSGLMPIERIKPGDSVLSQNPESGELTYKIVTRATVRPARQLLQIETKQDRLVCTPGHPFWVIGKGWRMAKEVRAGDRVQTIHGGQTISHVASGPSAETYNLIVADFNTYFVGTADLLVHDGTWRRPTNMIVPGMVKSR